MKKINVMFLVPLLMLLVAIPGAAKEENDFSELTGCWTLTAVPKMSRTLQEVIPEYLIINQAHLDSTNLNRPSLQFNWREARMLYHYPKIKFPLVSEEIGAIFNTYRLLDYTKLIMGKFTFLKDPKRPNAQTTVIRLLPLHTLDQLANPSPVSALQIGYLANNNGSVAQVFRPQAQTLDPKTERWNVLGQYEPCKVESQPTKLSR